MPPASRVGLAGVIAIEDKTGAVTVSVVEPLIEPETAWIVLEPNSFPETTPKLILATAGFVLVHVTVYVRSEVWPLL